MITSVTYPNYEAKITDLEREIARLRKKNKELEDRIFINGWKTNPDRMGGAFSEAEINQASEWR